MSEETTPHIGTLTEKSLHAALKDHLSRPGDEFEVRVSGFVIDIVRGEQLIEIQTRNFSAMKNKLARLLKNGYAIHLVYPVAERKWIVRQREDGEILGKRRSPKRGRGEDAFREMLRIPRLLLHPNLTFEVLLTEQEEVWRDDGQGSWRRKGWSVYDNRLLGVTGSLRFEKPADYLQFIPEKLDKPFTNKELAGALKIRRTLAQKMTYTLRKMDLLVVVGKRKRSNLMAVKQEE